MKYAILVVLALLPSVVLAEDTVDCGSTCPDGQVLVSFADGNNSTCLCAPAAQMDETVPDPDVGVEE